MEDWNEMGSKMNDYQQNWWEDACTVMQWGLEWDMKLPVGFGKQQDLCGMDCFRLKWSKYVERKIVMTEWIYHTTDMEGITQKMWWENISEVFQETVEGIDLIMEDVWNYYRWITEPSLIWTSCKRNNEEWLCECDEWLALPFAVMWTARGYQWRCVLVSAV